MGEEDFNKVNFNMLRIMTISKPYVASAYRQKLHILSQVPNYKMSLVCPLSWAGQNFETDTVQSRLSIHSLPIYFNGHNHFFFYKNIFQIIKKFRPHILNIEEEHYSIVTWQLFRMAIRVEAVPIFYTWQNIYKKYPPPFSWIEQFIFKHAGWAITGNEEAISILRKKGFKKEAFLIPQMGADIKKFSLASSSVIDEKTQHKKKLNLSTHLPCIMYAGRMVEEKGLKSLISALKKIDHLKWQLLLIGSGPYLKELRELTQNLKFQNKIFFISQVDSYSMSEYFKACDIFCLPSLTRPNWKEQFGRVLVESMAAHACVLGSSSGEIPHVIQTNGMIFEEGNENDLADKLGFLIQNAEERLRLAECGFKHGQLNYSNEVIAEKYRLVFDSLDKKFNLSSSDHTN